MKKLVVLCSITFLLIACNSSEKKEKEIALEETEVVTTTKIDYASFGEKITDEGALSKNEIIETYKNLKIGDTVMVKFTAKVNEVCQSKGCWMRLDIGDEETMVRFKDYGFFMPKNIAGNDVVVNGKAFISQMSVEEQQHYAKDAGKSKEEIEAITEVERTLSFEADGVLVAEK